MKTSKCVSMGPLAVSPSAVTRDRPAVASTHHGTTTLSGYPPRDHHRHRQQTLDSNLSHSQPPQGDNPPRRRTGSPGSGAPPAGAPDPDYIMQSQSEAPSNNTKSPPLSVPSTSTPSQRPVQLRLHHVLHSASLSPLTVTPERRRPSGTTDPKPRPNKTMFKRTRHDPTGAYS
ncbi:unnamed protein product [Boreogadus saida]